MQRDPDWISSREAARRLDVKLDTLYAYVSRGLVESVPGGSGHARRYARASVERLKARHDARKGHGAVAAAALRWGEPTLETSISEIRAEGPFYRGYGAIALCEREVGFESVCELLWSGRLARPAEPGRFKLQAPRVAPRAPGELASANLAAAVSLAALRDPDRGDAREPDEIERARAILAWFARLAGGQRVRASARASVAERLAHGFGMQRGDAGVRAIDRALILCADHELNASTFAARVAASTRADLYACLGAALHVHTGGLHGAMSDRVEALLTDLAGPAQVRAFVRARLARGEAVPGFGHPLYPAGDPRAAALIELALGVRRPGPRFGRVRALLAAMADARQSPPNLDVGLAALTAALDLPRGSGAALFAVGRTAGWVAHALEQRRQGFLLRPRARYVGSRRADGGP